LWAGVGVFVLIIAVVNCDNDEESAKPTEEGFVYVGTMEGEKNHVYKLNALTGEKVFGLGGQAKAELYIAVDDGNGDVFIYCTSSLSRYSKSGELYYDVYIGTGGFMYDQMVYDEAADRVWIYTCDDGHLEQYRGEDGEFVFRFSTGFRRIEQLVYDEKNDALWVVNSGGYSVRKFSPEGRQLLELKEAGRLTSMASDYKNDTVVFGYYDPEKRKTAVRRYTKAGEKADEFATTLTEGMRAKSIAVEPGTRNIWISDGLKTEIYTPDGNLVHVLVGNGFLVMDFSERGTMFFGINAEGYVYALRTADLKELWTAKTILKDREFLAVKYSKQ
jgi:outer membrane protein assembly factor BamB